MRNPVYPSATRLPLDDAFPHCLPFAHLQDTRRVEQLLHVVAIDVDATRVREVDQLLERERRDVLQGTLHRPWEMGEGTLIEMRVWRDSSISDANIEWK
jgi:hypothetical protein